MGAIAACPGFVPETLGAARAGPSRFFYTRALRLIPGARPASVSGDELSALTVDLAYANGGHVLCKRQEDPVQSGFV